MLGPTLVPCLRLCSQTLSSLSWRICESFKSEWWVEVLRGEIAAFVLKARPPGPTTPSLVQTQGTCHQLEVSKKAASQGLRSTGPYNPALTRNHRGWDQLVVLGWLTASVPQFGEQPGGVFKSYVLRSCGGP